MILNDLFVAGKICQDIEVKTVNTSQNESKTVTNMSVAVYSKTKTDKEGSNTAFVDVEAWGKVAEHVATLKKGDRVLVTGQLSQNRWKDSEGKSRNRMYVVASSVYPTGEVENKA